ncbi:hypothetical protein TNCV_678421 [Trichonephila clavipes]|nr:hypothetical protein TNCV_678421 [Trichonephila clavipes]
MRNEASSQCDSSPSGGLFNSPTRNFHIVPLTLFQENTLTTLGPVSAGTTLATPKPRVSFMGFSLFNHFTVSGRRFRRGIPM